MDKRSEKGIFVGYDKGSPAYLVYFPETKKVKKVRCVKFLKNNQLSQGCDGYVEFPHDPIVSNSESNSEIKDSDSSQSTPETVEIDTENIEEKENDTNVTGTRTRTRPKYLDDYVTVLIT